MYVAQYDEDEYQYMTKTTVSMAAERLTQHKG
jgi:hypothetical protein